MRYDEKKMALGVPFECTKKGRFASAGFGALGGFVVIRLYYQRGEIRRKKPRDCSHLIVHGASDEEFHCESFSCLVVMNLCRKRKEKTRYGEKRWLKRT